MRLVGRAKDLIIRGGHNIDPAVIEDALLEHREVTAAVAVGRPDAHAGEVPVAYVTLAAGAAATETELRAWAKARVPEPAAAPKRVEIIDAVPVTAVGKPFKPELRRRAAEDVAREALAGRASSVTARLADGQGIVVTVHGAHERDGPAGARRVRLRVGDRVTQATVNDVVLRHDHATKRVDLHNATARRLSRTRGRTLSCTPCHRKRDRRRKEHDNGRGPRHDAIVHAACPSSDGGNTPMDRRQTQRYAELLAPPPRTNSISDGPPRLDAALTVAMRDEQPRQLAT